ncbi:MAG: dockerin type I repeat-containing protein, partial [Ruminococcus sp.]
MTRNRNRVLSILISLMLIMSMVFSCVPMANAASTDVQSSGGQEIGLYGDVDMNGEINIRDVTRIQKHATYVLQLTDVQMILADVNQDGRVNVQDATALQKYILGVSQVGVVAGEVATEPDPTSSTEETTSSTEETTSSSEETTSSTEETTSSSEETSASVPADMVTVNLDVSAIGSSGSRYAVYTFDGAGGESWVDMTNLGSDRFTVELDKNTFTGLVFCRMDGETTENNWDNTWNQTEDLTLDGTLYTITGWGSGFEAKLPGVWSTEEPTSSTEEETTTTVEETTTTVEETTTTVEETTTTVEETTTTVEETSSSSVSTTRRVWFRND